MERIGAQVEAKDHLAEWGRLAGQPPRWTNRLKHVMVAIMGYLLRSKSVDGRATEEITQRYLHDLQGD